MINTYLVSRYHTFTTMKERITITVDQDLLRWIDKKVDAKIYANRSHALEYLIHHERQKDNHQA